MKETFEKRDDGSIVITKTEEIIITKTIEEVIEDPQQVLGNLKKTLEDIAKERKRLDRLEAEVKGNIEVIGKHIGAYIVNVTEGGRKVKIHSIDSGIDFDPTRGDVIAFNETDAKNICDAKMNEASMKKEKQEEKELENEKK